MTKATDSLDRKPARVWEKSANPCGERGAGANDFPIFMCALGDRLRMQSADGDQEATRLLASLAPRNIPAAARKAWRDAEIRLIATWLRGTTPATTDAIAKLLTKAGATIEAGRRLSSTQFPRLDRDELAFLESRVRMVIEVTRRPDGSSTWPGFRQLVTVLQFSPLEISER